MARFLADIVKRIIGILDVRRGSVFGERAHTPGANRISDLELSPFDRLLYEL